MTTDDLRALRKRRKKLEAIEAMKQKEAQSEKKKSVTAGKPRRKPAAAKVEPQVEPIGEALIQSPE